MRASCFRTLLLLRALSRKKKSTRTTNKRVCEGREAGGGGGGVEGKGGGGTESSKRNGVGKVARGGEGKKSPEQGAALMHRTNLLRIEPISIFCHHGRPCQPLSQIPFLLFKSTLANKEKIESLECASLQTGALICKICHLP